MPELLLIALCASRVAETELRLCMQGKAAAERASDGRIVKKHKTCSHRKPVSFHERTGGTIWGFCTCGFFAPPIECPSAESTTMVSAVFC